MLVIWLVLYYSSVAQSCPTVCGPMDCSRPGFPVHHQLQELAQTHIHHWRVPFEALLGNWATSWIEVGNSGSSQVVVGSLEFLSSCNGEHRDPAELQLVIQASSWVSMRNSGFFSKQENPASSRVEVGNMGFFLSCSRKLGVPLKLPWLSRGTTRVAKGNQASFHVAGGTQDSSWVTAGESGLIYDWGRKSGFLSRCGGYLCGYLSNWTWNVRETVELPFGSQDSFCAARGNSGFLLSHCRGIGPHLRLRRNLGDTSPVVTGISGFRSSCNSVVRPPLELRHGTPVSSWVVKGVSGLILDWDGELGFFLELQQGSQTSTCVVRGN